jgi:hypothetical protein
MVSAVVSGANRGSMRTLNGSDEAVQHYCGLAEKHAVFLDMLAMSLTSLGDPAYRAERL